jgi:hypothetical protein
MVDIEKALVVKKEVDLRTLLLDSLRDLYKFFLKSEADKLAPFRGLGVNYSIELVEKDGKTLEIP